MGLEKLNPFKHHDKTDDKHLSADDGLAPAKSTSSIRSVKEGVKKIFEADTHPREATQTGDRKFNTDFMPEDVDRANRFNNATEKTRVL